jgi:hypothetical protein
MSELVKFVIPEGAEVTLRRGDGRPFAHTMKRDLVAYSMGRGEEGHTVTVREGGYTVTADARLVRIENGQWCPKCGGSGEVRFSSWKGPERCFRCNAKGFLTAKDEHYHQEYLKRRYSPEVLAEMEKIGAGPVPF